MSKKLFSLAPLLAIFAFAVMPAASQAAPSIPHWFKGATRQAEGVKVPVVTWGGAVDLSQESAAGFIQCKGVGAGYIENPKGVSPNTGEKGPQGAGASQLSAFYECNGGTPKACEEGVKAKLGALGYVGVPFAVTYNFPWVNQLQPALAESFEEKIGTTPDAGTGQSWGIAITGQSEAYAEGFPAKYQAPGGLGGAKNGANAEKEQGSTSHWGAPGAIGAVVGCEIFPNPEGAPALGGVQGQPERVSTSSQLQFEGELHPLIGGALNGVGPASPSQVEFTGPSSGTLEDPLGPGAGGSNKGQVKYNGYETQSLIRVNPFGTG